MMKMTWSKFAWTAAAIGVLVIGVFGIRYAVGMGEPPSGDVPAAPTDVIELGGDPAYSPDGQSLAYTCNSGESGALMLSRNGDAVQTLTGGPGRYYRPTWSPDGLCLAYLVGEKEGPSGGMTCNVWVYDLRLGQNTTTPLTVFYFHDEYSSPPIQWFPDGSNLLTSGPPIAIWDVASKSTVTVTDRMAKTQAAAVSPGSLFVAWLEYGEMTVFLKVYDVGTAQTSEALSWTTLSFEGRGLAPEWVTEDQVLVPVERPDGTLGICSVVVSSGATTEIIYPASMPIVSPDGSRVAFATEENGGENGVYDLATGQTTWIAGTGAAFMKWSPHGTRLLLFGRLRANAFDLGTGTMVELLSGSEVGWYPEWSPDDARLAFAVTEAGKQNIVFRGIPGH